MTSALRKKLLSLAIRGKLVPQDPADEPASVLLERIRAEREAKENESPRRGRGRRSSSDNPPCPKRGTPAGKAGVAGAVFEPPFPIPESWVWTRLGAILKVPPRNGYSPKPVANKTKTKRLTLTATTSGYFKPEEFKYVADEIPFDSYLWLKPGDLLVQRSNSIEHIGTSCIFNGKPHEYIYPDLMMKLVLAESLDIEFFDLVLKSDDTLHYFQRNATGSAGSMPKINKEILENTTIPLPPVAEQHAIVARFKKLSSLCDAIDTAEKEIDAISRHAKRRILDFAIRGLLVTQNPTDEPAAILLDRIRLTADKPPCTKLSHETLFQIPESWVWTTLDNVICPTETTAPSGTTFTYIDIDAIDNKENTIKDPKTLLTAKAQAYPPIFSEGIPPRAEKRTVPKCVRDFPAAISPASSDQDSHQPQISFWGGLK